MSIFLDDIFVSEKSQKKTIKAVADVIKSMYNDLCFDEFSSSILVAGRGIKEQDIIYMHAEVESEMRSRIPESLLMQALEYVAYSRPIDRLRSFLNMCQENWDGKPRIDRFFPNVYRADDDEYTRAVAKNFFLSAVARALRPGCFQKHVLVLIGPQDVGKSRSIAELGGEFFREITTSITSEKDFFIALQGVWLAEIAEMDSFRRADRNRIKSIISAPIDRYRPPYSRVAQNFPRRCVFVATTNDTEVYDDPTGGSRFLPIYVQQADIEYVRQFREQLWGEAVVRYEAGETYWHVPDAHDAQERVRKADEWEELLRHFLAAHPVTTISECAQALEISPNKLDRSVQNRIVDALRIHGYSRKLVREGGQVRRVWVRQEEGEEQVEEIPDPF